MEQVWSQGKRVYSARNYHFIGPLKLLRIRYTQRLINLEIMNEKIAKSSVTFNTQTVQTKPKQAFWDSTTQHIAISGSS